MIRKLFLTLLIISVALAGDTYVLIHGAATGAFIWYKVKALLEEKGHTAIAFDLPGLGVDKTASEDVELEDHVNKALSVLDALSKPAIVVAHSYGGLILSLISEARPEKVKKAIYISGFMLQNGESLAEAGKRDANSLLPIGVLYGGEGNATRPEAPSLDIARKTTCPDCSNEDLTLISLLSQFQPKKTIFTPITIGEGFTSVPKVYISTLLDNTVTPGFQKDMYSKFPGTRVYKIESGHQVLLAKPQRLVEIFIHATKV